MRKILFALALTLLLPTVAYGQVVINPTKAQFNPSQDHNVVENGTALVTNYELQVFIVSGVTPVRVLNLLKPTPDGNNLIIVDIAAMVATLPVGDYVAKVLAKGPGGETASELSNPFQVVVRKPTAPTNLLITK